MHCYNLVVGCRWNDTLLHMERVRQTGPSADSVESGVAIERTVHCASLPRPGEDVTLVATLFFEGCVGRVATPGCQMGYMDRRTGCH